MKTAQNNINIFYSSIINFIRSNSNRKNDNNIYLHASNIMEVCPRYIYYVKTKKLEHQLMKKPQGISIGLAMTYGIGIAIEKLIVDSIALNKNVDTLFAYRCPKCNKIIISNKKKNICNKCNLVMLQEQLYIEHKIYDNIYINGHPDLLLRINNNEDTFNTYEIKSINPSDFDVLKQPLLHHIYQLKTYLYLIKNLKFSVRKKYKLNYRYGYIIYIKKTFDNQPIKIFKVNLDKKFIDYIEDISNQIKNSIEANIAPRRCCNSKSSILAKNCPAKSYCFRNVK